MTDLKIGVRAAVYACPAEGAATPNELAARQPAKWLSEDAWQGVTHSKHKHRTECETEYSNHDTEHHVKLAVPISTEQASSRCYGDDRVRNDKTYNEGY